MKLIVLINLLFFYQAFSQIDTLSISKVSLSQEDRTRITNRVTSNCNKLFNFTKCKDKVYLIGGLELGTGVVTVQGDNYQLKESQRFNAGRDHLYFAPALSIGASYNRFDAEIVTRLQATLAGSFLSFGISGAVRPIAHLFVRGEMYQIALPTDVYGDKIGKRFTIGFNQFDEAIDPTYQREIFLTLDYGKRDLLGIGIGLKHNINKTKK